mmetsp:Transcript_52040/g.169040  ORF Transcript_52040/g.169040 Transcript_52040/m.169040 type:complete len:296 (-) Transcript_52040:135-1022(-)
MVAVLEVCALRRSRRFGHVHRRLRVAPPVLPTHAHAEASGLHGGGPHDLVRQALARLWHCGLQFDCRCGSHQVRVPQEQGHILRGADLGRGRGVEDGSGRGWPCAGSLHGRSGLLRLPRRVPLRGLERARHPGRPPDLGPGEARHVRLGGSGVGDDARQGGETSALLRVGFGSCRRVQRALRQRDAHQDAGAPRGAPGHRPGGGVAERSARVALQSRLRSAHPGAPAAAGLGPSARLPLLAAGVVARGRWLRHHHEPKVRHLVTRFAPVSPVPLLLQQQGQMQALRVASRGRSKH